MAFRALHFHCYLRYELQQGQRWRVVVIQFIADSEIYEKVICGIVPQSRRRLWLATADLKDLYVSSSGTSRRDMVPFLAVLASLLERGVELRLIHAKEPGPNFRQDFDRYPGLWTGLERVLCPRVHFKCVISDGRIAYILDSLEI